MPTPEETMVVINDLVDHAKKLAENYMDENSSDREYRELSEYVETAKLCVLDVIEDAVKAERERIISLITNPRNRIQWTMYCDNEGILHIYYDPALIREALEPKP